MQNIESIDEEWEKFLNNEDLSDTDESNYIIDNENEIVENTNINEKLPETPKPSDIYISTKTKICYLNSNINLIDLFWKIPVITYGQPKNGVVKKQMKFNSFTKEEVEDIHQKLNNIAYYDEQIITSIDNPNGRVKFKDIRKISIGISKKDILNCRTKKKSAFYNCIVLILRLKQGSKYKEYHTKIFNTGKLEIPGIQNNVSFHLILDLIVQILQPLMNNKIIMEQSKSDTVLINSNFNCGFYINREELYNILKMKYNIHCIYDPCSYPGIQCKFYFNPDIDIQTGTQIHENEKTLYQNIIKVSFMIFRTGSVLIVGRCDETVLNKIYDYIKKILINEYTSIYQYNNSSLKDSKATLQSKKKIRKKTVLFTNTQVIN